MKHTSNDVLRNITSDYLSNLDVTNPPDPATIEQDILMETAKQFEMSNSVQPKGAKWRTPTKLNAIQVAKIMLHLYPIKCISTAGASADKSYDLLAIYQTSGRDEGIYVTDDDVFKRIMLQYNFTMSPKEMSDCLALLKIEAEHTGRTTDQDLIAVNNGIFNYETKQLMPFSPDYVFMSKSRVDYNPSAKNVTIHNNNDGTDWDVESWMASLSDDPEIVNVLWEILGAIIRPFVSWNKSAWFYSEKGNNGKGTLCELMRELCGENSYASIPLSDMGTDFLLEPLTRASAIIVDENDVGTYIDKAANLKSIITNDVIQINRKFKDPIAYKFYGFMVQCLNEMPRIKDKSDSFFRRQLFIPFLKNFTGSERKYIKKDYLHRKEVLEYVMFKILNMNYYDLSEPEACKVALEEYKEYNDPVLQFAREVIPECKWNLLPFNFLYDLYKAWSDKTKPSGTLVSRNKFIEDLCRIFDGSPDWECFKNNKRKLGGKHMSEPEPLIAQYKLDGWLNPESKRGDPLTYQCSLPAAKLNIQYRGLFYKGDRDADAADTNNTN